MSILDRRLFVAGAAAALTLPANAQPAVQPRRKARPMTNEAFSKAQLARMHDVMAGHVASGRMPGLVTLVSRRGETHVDAIGTLAFGASAPMRRNTIFRVASISKPITAAAAMMLVEEGRLRLDDPVDQWLPELANRKVLRAIDAALDDTVPAKRAITLRDLLTFRLGLGAVMVFPAQYPIQKAIEDAGVAPGPYLPQVGPDELMRRYGSLPLIHQPGEKWLYDTGSHILGMKDTGFHVPEAKLDRLATAYWTDFKTGERIVFDEAGGRFAKPPAFESGSGGLVSTVDDYLAFSRMMLNHGRHGGTRILSRMSVELMTTDHIAPEQKAASPFFANFWDNRSWGFGLSVFTRRDGPMGVGSFGWDGGYGTSAYMDPKEDLIGILMTQRVWDSPKAPDVLTDFWTQAYAAVS
jgi:CubicO group peptidase (beta-lactamase class C family)